ncbi:subtilase family protein [Kordia periserrulae]|uniref:Subtilase family protein n=1 Tax=Kordia periserrulae TaxID=701523 RepID=A0A2T6BVQ8_9FLAO|nr:S8 family serine peptidase [Kordia periserrulae]PTX60143.1 subtilase family protein [Kordia periserrulae]
MKKVTVYCFALLLMTLVSCQKETLNSEETDSAKEPAITQKNGASNTTDSDGNELIILYPDGTTEAEKILKRAEYQVVDYKKCECADPNLELWIFEKDDTSDSGSDIEDKKVTAKADEEIEGAEYNPNIKIQEDQFIDFAGIGSVSDGILKRVAVNQGVTVAVLDTGIMYDYPDFVSPFLYNSSANGCSENGFQEEFGWNFVDQNNNPYDDHYGRHGTIVTKLITSKLDAASVSYQILPVKVANRHGNISYFDALCGFQYAANKGDVDVINMSFGWTYQQRELLQYFIEEANDILVVTSAGNTGQNNDVVPHFPSSYESDNVVAVAALSALNSQGNNADIYTHVGMTGFNGGTGGNTALAGFSNRGVISVDIAAPGEYLPFTYNNEVFYISGTSYSAALTSGYGGVLHTNGMTGLMLKNTIIQNSIYHPDLSEIQYSKHIPD